jgi:predicted transcriptional regulator
MRTKATPERPRICIVLDAVLTDAERADPTLSNKAIARAIGVSDAAVGRWRKWSEPSRDDVLAIENFIGKTPGHVDRIAGYVKSEPSNHIPTLIRESPDYDESDTEMLLRVELAARQNTQEKRDAKAAQQKNWVRPRRPV